MPGRPRPILEALELQQLLLKDARNPDTTASARAQLARAWDVLEERKRILRMKPKPKDLDVSKAELPRHAARSTGPIEATPGEVSAVEAEQGSSPLGEQAQTQGDTGAEGKKQE